VSLASVGSLVGGALILTAFLALQLGRLDSADRRYLALNVVGGVVLVVSALMAQLWGFVMLNVVWAGASAWALASQLARRRRPEH
jgi:ethanolamine transporter EutH